MKATLSIAKYNSSISMLTLKFNWTLNINLSSQSNSITNPQFSYFKNYHQCTVKAILDSTDSDKFKNFLKITITEIEK